MADRVTIQDIADALGVSRNTVSKAINNTGILAESTREKVLNKAREMGYKQFSYLNMTSFSKAEQRSARVSMGEVVLFTTGFIGDLHFSSTMLDKFQNEISQLGYSFTMHRIREEEIEALSLPASYDRERTVGILCIEMFDKDYCAMLCGQDVPVLFVDSPVFGCREPWKADYLYMDNQSGIHSFVAEMARRGKKRIGFIGEYMHCQSFYERFMGYRNAMYLSGLPCREEDCILGNKEGVRKPDSTVYQEYLAECLGVMKSLPDVFICVNDFAAIDVLAVTRRMGISVPGDVWLCGFDDSPESRLITPSLTTVRIHSQIMGLSAVQLLVSRIKEPTLNVRKVYTETTLIYRESTGDYNSVYGK
ncbi:MAG TPA: LacI family transcriptional regulator [Lachnospiraceae bacterium]|nr:LacI family transcriptional regulator [Lachnospiraceae bacterium]